MLGDIPMTRDTLSVCHVVECTHREDTFGHVL